MAQQGIDLQPVARTEDRRFKHLIISTKLLKRSLHGLLGNAEAFPDLHRSRAVTKANNGYVHGG